MLSIIIPTYNEIQNLKEFMELTINILNGSEYELIIVDDNSPDGTGILADNLQKKYSNIKVLHRKKKFGIASAIIDGANIACGDIIATINADFQHPAKYLTIMLKYMNKFDVVIASRYVKNSNIQSLGALRYILSRAAIYITYLFAPKISRIKDPLSGLFAFKREVIKNIQINTNSSKCLIHILGKGSYNSFIELPYSFNKRKEGISKLSFKDCLAYFRDLTTIRPKLSKATFQYKSLES